MRRIRLDSENATRPSYQDSVFVFLKLFLGGCYKLSVHFQISHKVDSDSFAILSLFWRYSLFKIPTLPSLLTTMKFKKL